MPMRKGHASCKLRICDGAASPSLSARIIEDAHRRATMWWCACLSPQARHRDRCSSAAVSEGGPLLVMTDVRARPLAEAARYPT